MSRSKPEGVSAKQGVTPPSIARNANTALQAITSAKRPGRVDAAQWAGQSSAERLRSTTVGSGPIQLARSFVRGNRILIRPERSDFPSIDLTNNVDAEGFSPFIFDHDYLVVAHAPRTLVGQGGLAAIGQALVRNPTPGRDAPSTSTGTRNNVGDLIAFDGDTNFVRSYVIPSARSDRSDTVVNYTIKGEHAMDEGFVLRFAELTRGNRIDLITYGEGNAIIQSFLTEWKWKPEVKRIWLKNAGEIFAAAARGGRR